jgi:hypothetical protein
MDHETMSTPFLFKRVLSLLRTTDLFGTRKTIVAAILVLGVWLSAVVFTETRHEFWRDEVRAFSLARAAATPVDLYQSIQHEGHPILWYLILYIGKLIVNTPLILPIAGIGIGFLAVAVFLFFAPLPFWLKGLFIFSAVPFYEYSVMARNYGISMLLLFVAAVIYRYRDKWSLLLALDLALLANTNAHSVIFVGLIAGVWVWDTVVVNRATFTRQKGLSLCLSLGVIAGGTLLSIICFMPKANTILTPVAHTLNGPNFLEAAKESILHPEQTFDRMFPGWFPPAIAAGIFFLAILGLLGDPPLLFAALLGEVGLGVVFRLVYAGYYRHQGLFIIFIVFLYWLFIDWRKRETVSKFTQIVFSIGLYGAILPLILAGIVNMRNTAWLDIRMEISSSKAFGDFLNTNATYRNAILIPEPDYLVESVPYYAKNPIYFPREQRFGDTVSWTTASAPELSLDQLLLSAREIQFCSGQRVLIVLGQIGFDFSRPGAMKYSYNKIFSWDYQSVNEFSDSTVLVADFNHAYDDENYQVFAVNQASASPAEGQGRTGGLAGCAGSGQGRGTNPGETNLSMTKLGLHRVQSGNGWDRWREMTKFYWL